MARASGSTATAEDKSEAEDEPSGPIAVDSDEREGNNAAALLGSGAPQIKVRANVGWGCDQGALAAGQTGTFIQTEEIRLNIQNGNLTLVEE